MVRHKMKGNGMNKVFDIYLAAPYTHENKEIVSMRVEQINLAASWLMRVMSYHVFSPISMSHPIAVAGGLPTDWEYWKAYDERVIRSCGRLLILAIDGWDQSTGVFEEACIAHKNGRDVFLLLPDPRRENYFKTLLPLDYCQRIALRCAKPERQIHQ